MCGAFAIARRENRNRQIPARDNGATTGFDVPLVFLILGGEYVSISLT
jgi:hypothetical protein